MILQLGEKTIETNEHENIDKNKTKEKTNDDRGKPWGCIHRHTHTQYTL